MKHKQPKLAADQGGATAIEYGLIAGAVALAVVTAVWTAGDSLQTSFSEIADAVDLEKDGESGRGIIFGTRPERN